MRNVKTEATKPKRKRLDVARHIDDAAAEGRPITLRIDDCEPLVIDSEPAYQKLWELIDDIETAEAVRCGIEEADRGEGRPAAEFFAELRRRYNIPDDQ